MLEVNWAGSLAGSSSLEGRVSRIEHYLCIYLADETYQIIRSHPSFDVCIVW